MNPETFYNIGLGYFAFAIGFVSFHYVYSRIKSLLTKKNLTENTHKSKE